jgi:hypothetical protein
MSAADKKEARMALDRILRSDSNFIGSVVEGGARVSPENLYRFAEDSANRLEQLRRTLEAKSR